MPYSKWLVTAFVEHHYWQNRAPQKISLSLSIIKTQVSTYYMVIGTLFNMYIILLFNDTGPISLEKSSLCLASPYQCHDSTPTPYTPPQHH